MVSRGAGPNVLVLCDVHVVIRAVGSFTTDYTWPIPPENHTSFPGGIVCLDIFKGHDATDIGYLLPNEQVTLFDGLPQSFIVENGRRIFVTRGYRVWQVTLARLSESCNVRSVYSICLLYTSDAADE